MTLRPAAKIACFLAAAAVFAVVARMCLVSKFNAHPDETYHVGAGKYYMEYWDPPKVGDERALGAYSNYGVSYLHQLDVVYFLAGKFARLVLPLAGQDYLALRLFNLALLAVVLTLFLRLPDPVKPAFLPLFVSPQIWYIFGYFNGDALPLAATFGAVYCVARILDFSGGGDSPRPPAATASSWNRRQTLALAGLGFCLGVIAVSKQNYYVFIAFALGFFALLGWFGRMRGFPWRKVLLALGLAALIFAARYGVNVVLERHQDPQAVSQVAEKMAAEDFKPSKQAQGKAFWGMNMRGQGVTFTEMFTGEWKWHVFTFRSAFGLYGSSMDIKPDLLFYRWIGRAFAAFLALALVPLAWRGLEGRAMLGLWLVFAFLTVFQSVWHSWTSDFQAQGRYLFPVLGMTGLLLARFVRGMTRVKPWLWLMGTVLYALSMWSFVAVGLQGIQR